MKSRRIRGCFAMVLLAIFLVIWTRSIQAVSAKGDRNSFNPLPYSLHLNEYLLNVDRSMKENHVAEKVQGEKAIGFRLEDWIRRLPDGSIREDFLFQVVRYQLASKSIERNVDRPVNVVCGKTIFVERRPTGKE